mgnify:CR=1 FL=1
MGRKMSISLSKYNREAKVREIGQKVSFINILEGAVEYSKPPEKIEYDNKEQKASCLLNYEQYADLSSEEGIGANIETLESGYSSVFKQEIDNSTGEVIELTRLAPVAVDTQSLIFRDFNISNNRTYQYVLYPFDGAVTADDDEKFNVVRKTSVVDDIHWGGWSITELHPVSGSSKKFTASQSDVWVFNLNVDTGEQTQNISRQEQQTLGQFNRYSQGKLNYISGSVTCLLGRDVLPASYIIKNNKTQQVGGYQEKMPYNKMPTSNERVDMLLGWRKVVYSSNPKLLKDRVGQSFLVTLNSSTNKPMDYVGIQPNTISFTWTEIGSAQDIQITGVLEED